MYQSFHEKALIREFVALLLQAAMLYGIPFIISSAADLKLGRLLVSVFVIERLLQNLALSDGLENIS